MLREMNNKPLEKKLNKNIVIYQRSLYLYPGYNMRSNEISAVIN